MSAADWPSDPALEQRVEALLTKLSLTDKVRLVSGQVILGAPDAEQVTATGVPLFHLADGPAGIRRMAQASGEGRATALPAPIALAATWSPELARQYGDVLGAEAAATGHNVLLGPATDLARAPLAGRTFESFGEDPLLHSRLVVPQVQAIQRRGVQACLKHFLLNNQEDARHSVNVLADQRALHELYLPPFEAAIREGRAASVMASYNRVDGDFVCDNRALLTDVLRGELGFRGWVMSDFGANQSTVSSALAGLDWELTFAPQWGEKLTAALAAGELETAVLDEMVRRILRPTLGMMTAQAGQETPPDFRAHAQVAQDIAEQSAVLLKNACLLPLDASTLRRVAVIGPDADSVCAAGGGSALVRPVAGISVLDGLRARLGPSVDVLSVPGADPIGPGALLPGLPPLPSSVLHTAGGQAGLRATYWPNTAFGGEALLTRTEPGVELNRGFFDLPGFSAASARHLPSPDTLPVAMSARWEGHFTAPASGDYTFSLTCAGSGRVWLGETLLIASPQARPSRGLVHGERADGLRWMGTGTPTFTAQLTLNAGETLPITVEYAADLPEQNFLFGAQVRLGWQPPVGTLTPQHQAAAELARSCDVAVVVVRTFESEAMDRPALTLPGGQEALIAAVSAANPRTVVLLMSGGAVDMSAWEEGAAAIVAAWYAGERQGAALARLLLGDVNPSGRLPLSFPQSLAHSPLTHPAEYPGVEGSVWYSEGLQVGYRGYDALGLTPRYAFGAGLSYTTFSYADLQLVPGAFGSLSAEFTLHNTGSRQGTETAQVYLELSPPAGQPQHAAPRKLVGWARATLNAGEQQRVAVRLDPSSLDRPFSRWDTASGGWQHADGVARLLVGASSQGLPLSALFHIPPFHPSPVSEVSRP